MSRRSLTAILTMSAAIGANVASAGIAFADTRQSFSYASANGINSYADIYLGKKFEPQKLTGTLFLPAVCKSGAKVPAVIIQHGSGYPKQSWYEELAQRLDGAGIAALVANSFGERSITGTGGDQTQLSKANRVYDTFAAFRALQKVPCIDPKRIGVTGYSFGGIISRDMVESSLAKRLGGGQVLKASVPVYPSCQARWEKTQPTKTKVHYLLAGRDDYTPARYCLERIPELKKLGWDVSYTVYPKAHHAFIADYSERYWSRGWTFRDCGLSLITPDGHEAVSMGSTRELSWREYVTVLARSCGRQGVTIGRDSDAREKAMNFTVSFFKKNL